MSTYKYRKITRKTVDGSVVEEVVECDGEDAKKKMEEMSASAEEDFVTDSSVTVPLEEELDGIGDRLSGFFDDINKTFDNIWKTKGKK